MLQVAMANRSGSNHQRAVGDCFGYGFIHLSGRQRSRGAHCRASVPECHVVGIHQPEMGKSKIAHGTGGRTDVERITDVHQDDAQPIEFGRNWQRFLFYGSPTEAIWQPLRDLVGPTSRRGASVANLLPRRYFTRLCNCKKFVKPHPLPNN